MILLSGDNFISYFVHFIFLYLHDIFIFYSWRSWDVFWIFHFAEFSRLDNKVIFLRTNLFHFCCFSWIPGENNFFYEVGILWIILIGIIPSCFMIFWKGWWDWVDGGMREGEIFCLLRTSFEQSLRFPNNIWPKRNTFQI
jgi:hypothetical protein